MEMQDDLIAPPGRLAIDVKNLGRQSLNPNFRDTSSGIDVTEVRSMRSNGNISAKGSKSRNQV
jgi:hypothetical protein